MSTATEKAAARRAKILAKGASRMAIVNGDASFDTLVSRMSQFMVYYI